MSESERFSVIRTASGAYAMRDRETGETMHPDVGALREAQLLYVEPSCLTKRLCDVEGGGPLVLLDVGLGAGTTAACALRAAEAAQTARRPLHIVSFDQTLAALELALRSEPAMFGLEGAALAAARAVIRHGEHTSARVRWRVQLGDVRETLPKEPLASADIVFWDPFSPRTDPSLWSRSLFSVLRGVCRDGATVHTYSAATSTRSALLLAGFAVGRGPKSGEKQRSSTLAALDVRALHAPLDASWLAALAQNARALPDDAPHDAFARLRAAPQFASASDAAAR